MTQPFMKRILLPNPIKKLLFELYCNYVAPAPIQNGKYYNFIPAWIVKELIAKMDYAVYNRNGVLIELNPLSQIDRKLISGQGHDPIVSDLIRACLADGGTFLDIGSNVGYFALLAAKLPNVKVLAFEPSPREIKRLYRNVCLNQVANIAVFPYGLAEKEQVIPLNIAGMWNPGMNSVVNLSQHADEQINCYFTALDSLVPSGILSDVRLCKIDVEGFEVPVLQGMAQSIKVMNKATFVVEISPGYLAKAGNSPQDIYAFFDNYGYRPKFGFEAITQEDKYIDKNEVFIKKL